MGASVYGVKIISLAKTNSSFEVQLENKLSSLLSPEVNRPATADCYDKATDIAMRLGPVHSANLSHKTPVLVSF